MEKGREKPILIVSFRPDFLGDILEASELAAMDGADFFLIDEDRNIVYAKEDALLSTSFDRSFSGIALGESGYELKKIGQKEYIIAYDTQALTGWKQVIMLPSTLFTASMEKVPQLLFVIGLLSSFFLVLLLKMLSGSMTKTLQTVLDGMKRLGEGKFMLCIPETEDHDMKMLVNKFNEMDGKIHRLIVENYEIKLKEKETQIMALNMQMNPHFLYNTLNSIKWMATIQGASGIAEVTTALARLLKRVAKGTSSMITLKEELDLVKDYFLIQQYRYGGSISIEYRIDSEELYQYQIHRFSLQPIVENALFHGIEPKGSAGRILVDAHLKTDHGRRDLQISVTDNGVGMTAETIEKVLHQKPSGKSADFFRQVGIANVNQRIQYDFGPSYGISIDSKPGVYTTMTILIPCISGAEKGQ